MKKYSTTQLCKSYLLSLTVILVLTISAAAQTEQWHKTDSTYGTHYSFGVGVDLANNIYVTSSGSNGGHGAPVIYKHRPDGSVAWNYIDNQLTSDYYLKATRTDAAGNTYLVGSNPNTTYDAVITKVDSAGSHQWSHLFNIAGGYDDYKELTLDIPGSIYATGTSVDAANHNNQRIMLTKFNTAGNVQWTQFFTAADSTANGMEVISDNLGNIVVGGEARTSDGHWQMQIVKFNSAGTVLWHQENLPSGAYSYVYKRIAADNAGNIYYFANLDSFTTGGFAPLQNRGIGVVKMNPAGSIQWARKYFVSDYGIGYFNCRGLDANGNLYIGGTSDNFSYGLGCYASLNSATGDTLWYHKLSGPGGSNGAVMDMRVAGSELYFTGNLEGIGTGSDFYTCRASTADGSINWSASYNGFSNSHDAGNYIALDNSGSVIVSGSANEYSTSSSSCTTIKYSNNTGIAETESSSIGVSVFPQPFQQQVNLGITMPVNSAAQVQVFDIGGKLILEQQNVLLYEGENLLKLNFNTTAPGIYFCTIQTAAGTARRKIICSR